MEEKIYQFISTFRIPLTLASIGIVLSLFSLYLIKKDNSTSAEITFSTEASQAGSLNKKISVDLEGEVVNPGVYQFDPDSRIGDAIAEAGGLSVSADIEWIEKNINKAAKLVDGGKIYIPAFVPQSGTSAGKPAKENAFISNGESTGLVNINNASQSELEELPGVGQITAEKIIQGRPYQTPDELKIKKIIGNALYDKIKGKITN